MISLCADHARGDYTFWVATLSFPPMLVTETLPFLSIPAHSRPGRYSTKRPAETPLPLSLTITADGKNGLSLATLSRSKHIFITQCCAQPLKDKQ